MDDDMDDYMACPDVTRVPDVAREWDAAEFFRSLTERNRLARSHGFRFARVSGLSGFEDALESMRDAVAMVCVSDQSDGAYELFNTQHVRRVKSVFMVMRHASGDMEARRRCLAVMRELCRQFLSVIIRQEVRMAEGFPYVDERVPFTEIEEDFFSGGACAHFQISYCFYQSLEFNPEEWL